MKKQLSLLALVALFASCSSEMIEEDLIPKTQTPLSRVTFGSTQEFSDTYEKMDSMTPDEFSNWIQSNNPNYEYGNTDDAYLKESDYKIQAIFNKNNEFQIADTVIWFNKGTMYVVSTGGKEMEISSKKGNPLTCLVWGKHEVIPLREAGENGSNLKGAVSPTGSLNVQVPFAYGSGRYSFKYVYELQAYRTTYSGIEQNEIKLLRKMEYKYKKWDFAGEDRICSMYVNGTLGHISESSWGIPMSEFVQVRADSKNEIITHKNGSWIWPIMGRRDNYGWFRIHRWEFNLEIKITEEIKDHPETRRTTHFWW